MATLTNGSTYRFICRADSARSLNVYGTVPEYLANVCLYTSSSADICQQWVYRETSGGNYLECRGNPGLVLDLFTGSSGAEGVTDYNAHIFNEVTSTSYITVEDASDGNGDYISIKLADYSDKYLTANQGSNGTSGGVSVNSPGNVYWYGGGLEDYSQDWMPVLVTAGGGDELIEVTDMPDISTYEGSDYVEYFHPDSEMRNGTWLGDNDGAAKQAAIREFYHAAFGYYPASEEYYLYDLYGAQYSDDAGSQYQGEFHTGVDMYGTSSLVIHSAHRGVVTAVGGNFGIVAIYNETQDVTYLYLHMDVSGTTAHVGSSIEVGDVLGTESNVGLGGKNNEHLHIEVRSGRQTVPAPTPTISEPLQSISPYDYLCIDL